MADQNNLFQGLFPENSFDAMSEAASRVKADVEHLIEGFDVKAIVNRVEEFGKENPVGLAMTALTLGVAVGILMRSSPSERTRSV
jgi:hypothetical protein